MRELSIAYGMGREAKQWYNKTVKWEELCKQLSVTKRTRETVAQYHAMTKPQKDNIKNGRGFVMGRLKDGVRTLQNVEYRSGLTADADEAKPDFLQRFLREWKYTAAVYTTHGHTPEKPRLRIVVPLTRDISADEYTAISRYFADMWGMEQFDACSFRANQLMYFPSTPKDGEFLFETTEGPWLDPDTFYRPGFAVGDRSLRLPKNITTRDNIAGFGDNITAPNNIQRAVKSKQQQDPLQKTGTVGAFCRTYSIEDAIATFLSDVYERCSVPDRYTYIPGESTAGLVVYDHKFAYSHHATDPANGQLCNAFDLVRIHKFGDGDGSFQAMCGFALEQESVKANLQKERLEAAQNEFMDTGDWQSRLEYDSRNGTPKNTLRNLRLILENDENLQGIVFNRLADGLEIKGGVPWEHPSKYWRDADDAQLVCYVDERYGNFSQRNYDIAVTKVADDRGYHPIRDYFEALPPWDEIPRAETVLTDYLGAEDNAYVRAVTRKALCAAYRRVYEPGVKFDYITVLNGPQGIGKSTLISKLGMEWFSDSLTLSDMNDKTAAEKLQGYWIHEIGEMAGMRKADLEKVKAFVSRSDDNYRAAFGRRVTPHPRQCVFFGTTNSEDGYLRDITGNRRFWNVRVPGTGKLKPWDLTQETVDLIWAEVRELAKAGETLFLGHELEEFAEQEQREAMERDDREGLIRKYLDTLLPDNWEQMDLYDRREYFRDPSDPTRPAGTRRREAVSNIEIWCECFGRQKEDLQPKDSYAIAAIMTKFHDWERETKPAVLPIYGRQRVYKRRVGEQVHEQP